ncbi:MAG TPA: YqiA/YcfP family alpha/beta fold hydrolase, partial [Salinimicrobium sp.]|nr:YqiA/YcfP family alpha/beta fold hydrolase [Salinimicrobium sp.]
MKNSKEMENDRDKILYLHGLESRLSDPKREMLEEYGEVIAPDLDYREDPNIIETLRKRYEDENFSAIIGSSMGGFAGYYLAKIMKVPALLFNPALPYRSVDQNIPANVPENFEEWVHLVLGAKDPTIKAADTFKFLSDHLPNSEMFAIHLKGELKHRIPL